jgi:hypothetical protein
MPRVYSISWLANCFSAGSYSNCVTMGYGNRRQSNRLSRAGSFSLLWLLIGTCQCRSVTPTRQGESHLCITFLGIALPQSQFPNSCVCELFIFVPRIGPLISCSRIGRSIVEIGTVAAQCLFWEYLFKIFCIGSLQCMADQAVQKIFNSLHLFSTVT